MPMDSVFLSGTGGRPRPPFEAKAGSSGFAILMRTISGGPLVRKRVEGAIARERHGGCDFCQKMGGGEAGRRVGRLMA